MVRNLAGPRAENDLTTTGKRWNVLRALNTYDGDECSTQALTALALDQFSFGILVVDAGGRIAFTNRMGRMLLQERSGFSLRAGRISALNPEEDDALLCAIAAAAGRGHRSILQVSAMGGDVQLAIGRLQGHMLGFATIFASTTRLASNAIQALRDAFELTNAESGIVAELLAGHTVNEAAAARGVTVNTARSHLRAILSKTNTSRQTELIRLLSSVLVFL